MPASPCANSFTSSQLRLPYSRRFVVLMRTSMPRLAPGERVTRSTVRSSLTSMGVRTRLLESRMNRSATVTFKVMFTVVLRIDNWVTSPPSALSSWVFVTGALANAVVPNVVPTPTVSPGSIRLFPLRSTHSTRFLSSSWYELSLPRARWYETKNVPASYDTWNWSENGALARRLTIENSSPAEAATTFRWVAASTESGMPSPSESLSAGRSVITASVEPMRSAAAPAAAAARTTCRERSTEPSLDSMGAGAYKELILRFSKLRIALRELSLGRPPTPPHRRDIIRGRLLRTPCVGGPS